jgi:GMP synthase-like glutamine amidotransferase
VPRILVFQHMEAGHPGIFRDLLRQDEVAAHTVRLDLGERIPDLGAFDALWVMGGPQDVWEEAEHPWLVEEKAAIREAVLGRAMPFLGICLGHQLLADALGGEVGPAAEPEIGVFEVELGAGAGHPLFAGLPQRSPFLQWHRAEVRRPPADAKVLASSPRCAVQAIAVGQRAFGL